MKMILASGSPRRKELLAQAGIEFDVIVSEAEEVITKSEPGEIVEELSACKAKAVAAKYPDRVVLGADTIVVLDGKVLGKPKSEQEAQEMIRSLQGRTHQVYTGVSLILGENVRSFHEKTDVHVWEMSNEEIEGYVATGDCMDKAGAYGIQGVFGKYIRGIAGDYYNVVGLPMARVYHEYHEFVE